MARKLRVEYSGAIYHLLSRGDRREPIFLDDADRQRFTATLAEVCVKTGWQVHAYVLMPNHFHLVVETPQPNLVVGMKWFLGTYTSRFNRRHNLSGHLFSGRYKSLIVDGSSGGYLRSVCDYVHLNPARVRGRGMLRGDQPLKCYAWSSWPAYLLAPLKRPGWMRVDRLLGEWGIPKDSPAGRRQLERALEARREEGDEAFTPIRRGWYLGDEAFRQELLAQMREGIGAEHYGKERAQTAEAAAEAIIAEELKRRRWKEKTLKTRPKGDPVKVALAARLRAETTMTVGWIAERLAMGTRGYLNHLLYRQRKSSRHYQEPTPIPTPNLVSTGSVATNCGQASVALDPDDAKNLIVTVGGDCNATNIAIGANGIIDDQGNVGYASLTYGKLIGDVDGSGMVDVLDGHAIRAEVPSFVDSSNFRDDLNHDGTVNARDHMIAKAHRGERLP